MQAEMHFVFNLLTGAIKSSSPIFIVNKMREQVTYYLTEERLKVTPFMEKQAIELVELVQPKDVVEFVRFFKLESKFDRQWFK